jgi:hypothetical protein
MCALQKVKEKNSTVQYHSVSYFSVFFLISVLSSLVFVLFNKTPPRYSKINLGKVG